MKINTSKINLNKVKRFYNSFLENGLPNRKKEDWKFTDLEKILNSNFDELEPLREKENYKMEAFLKFDHYYLISINGELVNYNLKLSDGSQDKKSTNLTKISSLNDHPIYSKILKSDDKKVSSDNINIDEMLSMNLAFTDRGYSFQIFKDLDKPLVIYNFFDEKLENKLISNSNLISISNSKVKIIELNIDKSKSNYFKNTFQKFQINESEVDYYFVNYNKSNGFNYTKNIIEINDSKSKFGSKLKYFIFGSGSKFRKDDYEIFLDGENSFAKINSAAILKKSQHHEIKTKMSHSEPNCESYQKIKNILLNDSKGIFQGKVLVSDRAQKTNAYQLSKGLILDDESEFSTKPELEIYADDVKCSHGSTSGNIDKDAVFYLMTRGLSKKEATKFIIKGFLNDVVSEIADHQVRELIENHLEENIKNEN